MQSVKLMPAPPNPNHDSNLPDDDHQDIVHKNVMARWLFFVMGFVFMGFGVLGVVTPGLPTTVFVLLAGYCWARSSRRFYGWLMRHKLFGKMLADWQERRAMPRFAKYMAWGMMCASSVLLFYKLPSEKLWVAGVVSVICLATSVWMARLPDA